MRLYGFALCGSGKTITHQVEAPDLRSAIEAAEAENPGWRVFMGRSLDSYPGEIARWKSAHPESQIA